MKIAIKFDDNEYIYLANAMNRIGIDLPLVSDEYDKYPIYYKIRKNPPSVYVNIRSKYLVRDIFKYIIELITYAVDEDYFIQDCKNNFGIYFEPIEVEFRFKTEIRKRRRKRK